MQPRGLAECTENIQTRTHLIELDELLVQERVVLDRQLKLALLDLGAFRTRLQICMASVLWLASAQQCCTRERQEPDCCDQTQCKCSQS